MVNFFGLVRANGCFACSHEDCICGTTPTPTPFLDAEGRRIFRINRGDGFLIVIEAKPGTSSSAVGGETWPDMGGEFPDLQIQGTLDLGDGSVEVCDFSGGVPGIPTPNFEPTPEIVDTLVDFSCRFSSRPMSSTSAGNACTLDGNGSAGPITGPLPSGSRQFCYLVNPSTAFPLAEDTLLTLRVRDLAGNLSVQEQIVVRGLGGR